MAAPVPKNAVTLMAAVYRKILPAVRKELSYWENRAKKIPNKELRTQALASIASKRFHCHGGSVYALLAGQKWRQALRFIVAYQTISDYLDNLCDRSTSLDPDDFRLLHHALRDALTPGNERKNYYALRKDQEDAGYLSDLAATCQNMLAGVENYPSIREHVYRLERLYEDLQVHKHVREDERIPRLTRWFEKERNPELDLTWYEFAAAAGSTLGIFCLVSYAMGGNMEKERAAAVHAAYFPYIQGLHILLDYYIDQEEDKAEGDLNFCHNYPNQEQMKERFLHFINQANKRVQNLPDSYFHEMVHQGLVGLYLGDRKVKRLDASREVKKMLLQRSGIPSKFFHWNTRAYYWFGKQI
ncbi:tetraprenyl-beta-curcumene synthase family protein [Virgibacillus sp. YIM 98842]|uniref:tetraprenyl-beta-curcumene synthase family protein n=1 Tax=Virgibacillus sp. YIM 98842 TaxID=2663533 RepID=UPI001F08B4E6|nr:tetraprenyl-beta-curcumene synthase family protein [Virgibacillus sp. YIM 98842]